MQNIPTRLGNPGDLRYVGQTGATPDESGFAKFPDAKTGYAALLNDIQTKINRNPQGTLVDFAEQYAPPSENNTGQYIANLANKLGVAPNATLKSLEPRIGEFAQAISSNEGFQANNANLPGVGALGAEIQAQGQAQYPTPPPPPSEPKPIPVGSAGQSLGTPDPSKTPLNAASKVTDALGLHGAVDTMGSNLASLGNSGYGLLASIPAAFGNKNAQAAQQNAVDTEQFIDKPSLEQNVGAGLQVGGTVAGLSAAPTTIPSAIATGGLIGASSQGGQAMTQNAPASEVTNKAATGGLVGGVTAGVLTGLGKLLGSFGDKIMNAEIKPSKADIEDGFSIENLKKHDLGGTLSQIQQKSQAKLAALHDELSKKLASSGETIDLAPIFDQTVKDVKTGSSLMRGFGSNTSMDGALKQLQNEVLAVNPDGGISIPDAQLVKQGAGAMGSWEFGRTDPDATAREAVYNKFYHNIKVAIENASPDGVHEINKQMQEIIPIQNAVLRRIPIANRNNPLSLTDFIGLVSSAAHPAALGPTILNFLSKSGAVGNQLSKFGPSIGAKLSGPASLLSSGFVSPQTTTSQGTKGI